MSFEAKDYPISDIFNKSVFIIPRNQRRYVWKRINWEELLEDIILSTRTDSKPHFFGSIVLKVNGNDEGKVDGLNYYTIIDGQQRLTTVTIMLLAIMKLFNERGMNDEFLGTIDYLRSKNNRNQEKLIMNSEYHLSLSGLIHAIIEMKPDDSSSISAFVDSHIISKVKDKQIGEALKYFYFDISKEIETSENPNERLLNIRDAITKMVLVKIVSSSEEDSYTIFEILNARGQELEDCELLKNYIMRYIQPEDARDEVKQKWEEMESALGDSMKRFIKHYTTHKFGNSKDKKESSYRTIQKQSKGSNIRQLLDDIKLKSEYYLKFINPIKNGEHANCIGVEYEIFQFFKSKKQEQFRPVILSLIHQKELGLLSIDMYEQALKYVYTFYVCYNIIGEERSNKLEDVVYKYARLLENDYSQSMLKEFAQNLKSRIPSYDWFENAFCNLGWSNHFKIYNDEKNKQRVKITLEIIEKYTAQLFEVNDFTIEHVLPDSESETNSQIGNLIPLEQTLNDRCGSKALAEKYLIYLESSFKSARGFTERYKGKEFSPEGRTRFLAKLVYNNILELNQFDFDRE